MKIRKGLLAAATATSVALTGVVAAPAFAEPTDESTPTVITDSQGTPLPEGSSGKQISQTTADMFYEKKDGRYIVSANKIISWLGVFTTFIAALGTAFNFVQKNINVKR